MPLFAPIPSSPLPLVAPTPDSHLPLVSIYPFFSTYPFFFIYSSNSNLPLITTYPSSHLPLSWSPGPEPAAQPPLAADRHRPESQSATLTGPPCSSDRPSGQWRSRWWPCPVPCHDWGPAKERKKWGKTSPCCNNSHVSDTGKSWMNIWTKDTCLKISSTKLEKNL